MLHRIEIEGDGFHIACEPPGGAEWSLPPGRHTLDAYLGGAVSDYQDEGALVRRERCPPNSFRFLHASGPRRVRHTRSGRTLRASFRPDLLAGPPAPPTSSEEPLHRFDAGLIGVATFVHDHVRAHGDSLDAERRAALLDCLLLRLDHCLRHREDDAAPPRPEAVQRGIEYVESQLAEPLSLERVASVGGISPFHFARLFRRVMGTSLRRYVIARRLDAAERALHEGEASIADVAYRCGFGSQSHMTTVMRKHLGRTPGAIRRGIATPSARFCQRVDDSSRECR